MNNDPSYKKQLQLLLTDLRYKACKMFIHIFKSIQKLPNLVYPIAN